MAAVGSRSGQVTVRAAETSAIDDESKPEDGKVENGDTETVGLVVRKWLVYEDRAIADRIQNEEIEHHYNKNRFNRRTVRDDLPVAKEVYSQEEAKAQYERMTQLEEQRRIAEHDEGIARELQSKITDSGREERRRKELHDEVVSRHCQRVRPAPHPHNGSPRERAPGRPQEFARHMQEREARMRAEYNQTVGSPPRAAPYHPSPGNYVDLEGRQEATTEDYQHLSEAIGGPTLASLQTGTMSSQNSNYDEEFDEEALEAEDRELAVRLQREEEERYERKKQQRLLAKERKRLERLIAQSQQQEQAPGRGLPRSSYDGRGPQEDDGDFSDFYIPPDPSMAPDQSRRLQEEQDAELARLMQNQEKKGPRSDALKDRLRQIESQDLELARIIQEEENLRAKRRALKHQQKLLQQQREVAEKIASHNQGAANTPGSTLDSMGSHPTERVPGQEPVAAPRSAAVAVPTPDRGSMGRTDSVPGPSSNERRPAGSDYRPTGLPRSDPYQIGRGAEPVYAGGRPPPSVETAGAGRPVDQPSMGVGTAASRPTPAAGPRQAKIPLNLPGRMMHNTDAELRPGSHQGDNFNTDIRDAGRSVPLQHSSQPAARPNMYAEKPSAGRGGYSPNRNARDASPPGPMLPERRYRDDHPSPPSQRTDRPRVHIGPPTQQPPRQGHHSGPPMMQPSQHQSRHATPRQRDQPQGRGQEMPPYRGLHPPPYAAGYQRSSEGSPSSPRSAETHYDAPWDMSQLESRLLRDASVNQQSQPIKPRQISPPGRRGEPGRSPPVPVGSGGRPLIEHNEDGQIVMNIAEMLDPTYSRRQGQRGSIAERPPSQNYEAAAAAAAAPDGEITAIAGQRRSGKKHAGKRESCKQQ